MERKTSTHLLFSVLLLLLLGLLSLNLGHAWADTPVFACDTQSNPNLAAFGFCNTSMGIEGRVLDLVGRLTLSEKIGFLVNKAGAVARLGIATSGGPRPSMGFLMLALGLISPAWSLELLASLRSFSQRPRSILLSLNPLAR